MSLQGDKLNRDTTRNWNCCGVGAEAVLGVQGTPQGSVSALCSCWKSLGALGCGICLLEGSQPRPGLALCSSSGVLCSPGNGFLCVWGFFFFSSSHRWRSSSSAAVEFTPPWMPSRKADAELKFSAQTQPLAPKYSLQFSLLRGHGQQLPPTLTNPSPPPLPLQEYFIYPPKL